MELKNLLLFSVTIVATITVIWNIIKEKATIAVTAMIGKIGEPGTAEFDSNMYFLIITITNHGKKPVQIESFNWKLKKPDKDGMTDLIFYKMRGELPKMLYEGEKHTIFTEHYMLVLKDFSYLYIRDSYNKKWKISAKNLKILREDVKALQKQTQ